MRRAALPLTADNTNTKTRAQLARVNFMRDEPLAELIDPL